MSIVRPSSTGVNSQHKQKQTETDANLAASATYTSPSVDTMNQSVNYARFTGFAFSDQAGTLLLDQSDDGTNWYQTKSVSLSANTSVTFDERVVAQFYRVRFTNGATAQTKFKCTSYTSFY